MRSAKKSLGQNFLIDKNIIRKIVNQADVKGKHIVEIGPGKGALTDEILSKNPKSLTIVEKDNFFFSNLKKKYLSQNNIKILNEDILKINLENILKKNSIIFGNLPYNISSQILVKILKLKHSPKRFSDLIFMFQKELGEKIIGKFSTKNYGRLSILTNYRLIFKNKFFISPNCFFPKPKVNSVLIHFTPKTKNEIYINKIENLEKITNILFSNRRKMINKNIKKILNQNQIKKIKEIRLNSRPSDLKPDIYYKITKIFEKGL